MQLFNTLLVQPIINLLVVFYHGLTFLHIPYALGFSIILMTVLIRLLMYPLTTKQLQVSRKMQEMAPHLSKIKDKHKGDMKRQQEATMALYKEHNVNPAAGCLPGALQIVILLFGLYPAMMKILTLHTKDIVPTVNHMLYSPMLHLTKPWDTHFLGLSLGQTPGQMFATVGPVILLIPVLTAAFQFIQSKMMIPAKDPNALAIKNPSASHSTLRDEPSGSDSKSSGQAKQEDFATMFQKQSLYLLPAMIGFFSWNFSVGLSLYWNTFTVFGIIQQYKVAGLGGVAEWVAKLRAKS